MTTTQQAEPGPGRRQSVRRPLTIVAAHAAAAVLGVGALAAVDVASRDHRERTTTFDAPIAMIDADVSAGTVHIVGSDEPGVSVTVRTRAGIAGPDHHERVEGDRLVLRSDCPSGLWAPSCQVEYIVRAPAALAVRARTSGGSARVEGMAGDVDASTSGGRIRLTFDRAPAHVKARTSGGEVVVEVPDGPEGYHVEAGAHGGATHVDVRTDPRSEHVIDARASGGTVTVRYTDARR
jgi:hypothetical protein